MNRNQILTAIGLGTLSVGLIALPGSSARKPVPACPQQCPACPQMQGVRNPANLIDEEDETLSNSQVLESISLDDDGDVQVFVGHGEGWLGVGVAEVDSGKAKELKLPAERGALLGKIVPDSPAAKAGLKENDVITEINGQRVEGAEQFRRMIREIPAGRSAKFTVWRDGHSQTIDVTLGKSEPRHFNVQDGPGSFAFQMPDMPSMPNLSGLEHLNNFDFSFSGQPRLGIDAENLDGDFGNYFGAPEGEGVLIRGVFANSPAATAGLKAGDVLTTVDGERIRTIGELREKLVEKKGEKSVKLGLLRNKAPLSVTVEIPPPAEKHEHHNSVRTNI